LSITDIGREGEILARQVLKNKFKCDKIFQADWLIEKNNKWYVIEVKRKERFVAPPFDGHGLNIYQAQNRLKFYEDTGIRCLFLVFDINDKCIYWQWLDILDEGIKHDTENRIRIYPLNNFVKLSNVKH
jgi:hypothetical protein